MIRAEQVRFQYKKRDVDGNVIATEEILKGVDITIKKGEFIALLGRNGSGKTTFSKQLNAILRPSEGTVTVDEMGTKDADKLYEIRQRVGMVSRIQTIRWWQQMWKKRLHSARRIWEWSRIQSWHV